MKFRRQLTRMAGLGGVCSAVLVAACSTVAPISLPVPGRSDGSAADTQARVVATSAALQVQAQATQQGIAVATQAAVQTATAAPTLPLVPVLPQVPVRRGPISETAQFDGRISAAEEVPISFSTSGVIAAVSVAKQQTVTAGQVLVDLDAKAINQAIKDAQTRADTTVVQMQLAQSQTDGRLQDAEGQALNAVRVAQDNLSKVQAGPSASERQAADQAVVSARAALEKAQADLNQLRAGASASGVRTAQQQLAADQLALRTAQSDKAKLLAGADPVAQRATERELANAQDALSIAQAELDALLRGPDQYQIKAAQRDIDRAQAQLANARSLAVGNSTGSLTQAQKDVQIADAQFALQGVQDGLAKLKEPPRPEVLTGARNKVDNAKATVATANDKLNLLRQAPDALALDRLNAAIDAAQATLSNDQAKLEALQRGASEDQLQAASSAVEAAQLGLNSTQARRDEVNGHPTQSELVQAQQQLADAQASLARARSGQSAANGGATLLQQKDLDATRQQIASLQQSLEGTHLRAPFDATVVSVTAASGDNVVPGKPVLTLAHPGDPIVTLTLPGGASADAKASSASRVKQGQRASVQVDGASSAQIEGSVVDVTDTPDGVGRVATLKVNWGSVTPPLGGTALVLIKVQEKPDALLVPPTAARAVGPVKYVDVMSGATRQAIKVETGITTDTDVEIVSGLTEGQMILSGRPAASSSVPANAGSSGPVIAPAPRATPQAGNPISPVATAQPSGETPTSMPISPAPAPSTGAAAPTSILDERFLDNRQNWPTNPLSNVWMESGKYHLEAREGGKFVAVGAPVTGVPSDVQVTATFGKTGGPAGGGYGIILRDQQEPAARDGSSQDGSFYVFEVGDKGEIGVWRRDSNRWEDLQPWTTSAAVQIGLAANTLSAQAVGGQFTFSVNGRVVASVQDATLSGGSVGVFVGGDGNQVVVNQFSVRPAKP